MKRIEIHAADHCVQKCQHCSHAADLVERPRFYGPDDYVPWLESMAKQGIGWAHIDILGGEPFLNPNLYELAKAVQPYCINMGIMTNCYWLRSEEDIEKYHHILRLFKSIIISLYPPLVERCGGLENVLRLVDIMRKRFPYVEKWHFGGQLQFVDYFATIKFSDTPRPIINTACQLRYCAVLRAEGYIIQCCAGLRVPSHPAKELIFDVSGKINKAALEGWLDRSLLDLCRYCSIATEGTKPVPWIRKEPGFQPGS